jgi:endoglucanase
MLTRLSSLIGPTDTQAFLTSYQAALITSTDLQQIAADGFNSVRVPFDYRILEDDTAPGVYKPAGWALLDQVISEAHDAGLYVILDMHGAPGSQNGNFTSDAAAGQQLYTTAAYQTRTMNLWHAIAGRYATDPTVLGYDLLNEPLPGFQLAQFIPLYRAIIAGVRTADPNHVVIVEGKQYDSDGSPFTSPLDANLVYSMHQYVWSGGSNLTPSITNAEQAAARLGGVPVWVGEMGLTNATDTRLQASTYDADPRICGWAYWTWKIAARSDDRQGLMQYPAPPSWSTLLRWMANVWGAPKPTATAARQGISDLLDVLAQPASPNLPVLAALS